MFYVQATVEFCKKEFISGTQFTNVIFLGPQNHNGLRQKQEATVIVDLFQLICQTKDYWNLWRSSEHWVKLILSTYPQLFSLNITKTDLNCAIVLDLQLEHCQFIHGSQTNQFGIYFQSHWCKNVQTVSYNAITPGTDVKVPSADTVWWQKLRLMFHQQEK